ncbi:hypothetical protein BDD12DRAFT_910658 [Trichophaea hybrida]|nr:hypothetical protein BDD12DRAFT_910658 [Trichophaea hybrida]
MLTYPFFMTEANNHAVAGSDFVQAPQPEPQRAYPHQPTAKILPLRHWGKMEEGMFLDSTVLPPTRSPDTRRQHNNYAYQVSNNDGSSGVMQDRGTRSNREQGRFDQAPRGQDEPPRGAFDGKDGKGIKRDATDALKQALNEEELHVEEVRSKSFVGNRHGFSFAKRIRTLERLVDEIPSLKNRVVSLGVKTASLEVKTASLKAKTASLQDRVGSVASSPGAYKLLRNCFISTLKRDKLRKATDKDGNIIGVINSWV